MERARIRALIDNVLQAQDKAPVGSEAQTTRELGFRSLDFSEVALRLELEIGRELNFEAAPLRTIETVADVLDFFEDAVGR
jgi:acyl carrier protein